jgi:hypothetical protein
MGVDGKCRRTERGKKKRRLRETATDRDSELNAGSESDDRTDRQEQPHKTGQDRTVRASRKSNPIQKMRDKWSGVPMHVEWWCMRVRGSIWVWFLVCGAGMWGMSVCSDLIICRRPMRADVSWRFRYSDSFPTNYRY